MDAAVKQKWVAALRSGEYTQGKGGLKQLVEDEVQHCCLGVLCEVLETPQRRAEDQSVWFFGTEENNHHGFLTEPVLAQAGLSDDAQHKLASMNDQGRSFAEIADYIDKNL